MGTGEEHPVIGITADTDERGYRLGRRYPKMVHAAGGTPIVLTHLAEPIPRLLEICGGFVLSGGDDPIMEHWGGATHPNAKPIDPARQAFELALLDALRRRREKPVLGVCLGMQLMGLHAGGALDQYLPETLPTAADHWERRRHPVRGELGEGIVHSHHRQALADAGELRVIATAPDGVIEAVRDDARSFYIGVQWHPERTEDAQLGAGLFAQLIEACRKTAER